MAKTDQKIDNTTDLAAKNIQLTTDNKSLTQQNIELSKQNLEYAANQKILSDQNLLLSGKIMDKAVESHDYNTGAGSFCEVDLQMANDSTAFVGFILRGKNPMFGATADFLI